MNDLLSRNNHSLESANLMKKHEASTTSLVDFLAREPNDEPNTRDAFVTELVAECIGLKMELANSKSRFDYLTSELYLSKKKCSNLEKELNNVNSNCKSLNEENIKLKEKIKGFGIMKSHLQSNMRNYSVERSALRMSLSACQEQRDHYREQAAAFEDYRVRSRNEKSDFLATIVAMRLEIQKLQSKLQKKGNEEQVNEDNSANDSVSSESDYGSESNDKSLVNGLETQNLKEENSNKELSNDLKQWSQKTFGRRISVLDDFVVNVDDLNIDDNSSVEDSDETIHHLRNNTLKDQSNTSGFFFRKTRQKCAMQKIQEQIDIIGTQNNAEMLVETNQRDMSPNKQETTKEKIESTWRNLTSGGTVLLSSLSGKKQQDSL